MTETNGVDLFSKVTSAEVQTSPFPHFAIDDFFPDELFSEIKARWPHSACFTPEQGYTEFEYGLGLNHVCKMQTLTQYFEKRNRIFWEKFINQTLSEAIKGTFLQYKPLIMDRFEGKVSEFFVDRMMLMECDDGYIDKSGLALHNHHWHAPEWIFTILIYIGGHNAQGTTLYSYDAVLDGCNNKKENVDRLAFIAAQTREWAKFDELKPQIDVDFIPNRLVCFADGPISFHEVKRIPGFQKSKQNTRGRRVIRVHAAVSTDLVEKNYGAPRSEWLAKFAHPSNEKDVIEWLSKNIAPFLKKRNYDITQKDFDQMRKIKLNSVQFQNLGLIRRLYIWFCNTNIISPIHKKAHKLLSVFR